MKHVERLIVAIDLNGKEVDVGEMVQDGRKIYFKYYPAFIDSGLQPLTEKTTARISLS